MANIHRGEIAVPFGESEIILRLSTNAICELEGRLEAASPPRKLFDLLGALDGEGGPSMRDVRLLYWAMMLEAKPDATEADAGCLIDGLAGDAQGIMSKALAAAFPPPSEGDDPGK